MTYSKRNGQARRCDGTCHRAKKPTCACICNGKYHGKGDQGARELHAREWQSVVELFSPSGGATHSPSEEGLTARVST